MSEEQRFEALEGTLARIQTLADAASTEPIAAAVMGAGASIFVRCSRKS